MALAQALLNLVQKLKAKTPLTMDTQWGTFQFNEDVMVIHRTAYITERIEAVIKEVDSESELERHEIEQLLELIAQE